MSKVAAFIALFVALFPLVSAVNVPYTHHAILNGAQAGTNSSAIGAAILSFNPKTGQLDYTIVNNVTSTTVAHIHGAGFPGVSAGVLVLIPGFESGANATVRGTVSLTSANAALLDGGQTYFNIHSNAFPNGEIRGQILRIGQQVSSLDGKQDGVVTTATGGALTTFDPTTNTLSIWVTHNVVNATLAHIHGPGDYGVSAPVLIPLANATTAPNPPFVTQVVLTAQEVQYLNSGLLYYNVHSVINPAGEIRGQIDPIVNFLAELTGAQDNQTTDAEGVGMVALYGTSVFTRCYHTVPNPTIGHIHTGDPGVSGPVTFGFASPNNPVIQNYTATSDQANDLTNGHDYFNIHTTAAPNGLIRGQIYPKLVDTAVVSTTAGSGTPAGTTSGSHVGPTSSSSASSLVCSIVFLVIAAALLA